MLAHRVIPKGYLHGGQREAVEALDGTAGRGSARCRVVKTMFRPQTTLRREGWYYLVIMAVVLGGAVFKEVNLLLILAGILLGPLLLELGAVRKTSWAGIDRKLPTGLCAGDPLSVTLNVTNAWRRLGAWTVVVEDQVRRVAADRGLGRAAAAEHRENVELAVSFAALWSDPVLRDRARRLNKRRLYAAQVRG